jgi:hypothetical protein
VLHFEWVMSVHFLLVAFLRICSNIHFAQLSFTKIQLSDMTVIFE